MSSFSVIPAIDLKGGKCVRLRQGVASEETVYSDDPVEMARRWEAAGGALLHVVDLDGAFQGKPVHTDVIRRIAKALKIPVEVGGGLRTREHVQELLDLGVYRAILGTRACESPAALSEFVKQFGEHLAVGIDARNGRVQIKGWTETTATDAVLLARELDLAGVSTLIYTDTALDGMMRGPNISMIQAVCRQVSCRVVASGGVAAVEHVTALAELNERNLDGVIVGKALYEGTVTLQDLVAAAEQASMSKGA